MNYRKFLLKMSFLVLSIFIITGCSSESSNSSDPTNSGDSGSGEVVKLDFWDMSWGPAEYIEAGKSLVDKFNEEHPNIQVTYQSTPWSNWYQTFSTAIASGSAPDISTGGGYQAFQFYGQDAILPIDDVIQEWKEDGKLDDFLPGTIDAMKYDGHYLALPWGIDTRMYWYRKDLFEEAGVEVPSTWDEFREAAKKLTTDDGQYALAIEGSVNDGVQTLLTLMVNNGGGVFTEDGKVNFVENERNQEAVQFLADLVADGSVNPASVGFGQDDASKSLGQGDAALILSTPGTREELKEISDNLAILPPLESPNGDKGTLRWVNNVMIYKQTEHPEEAKIFLKWWSENQLPLWTEGHSSQLPVRTSMSEHQYFQDNEDFSFIYDHYIPIGAGTGERAKGGFPELNEVEADGTLQDLAQRILSGEDVLESMKIAEKGLKEIMGEE